MHFATHVRCLIWHNNSLPHHSAAEDIVGVFGLSLPCHSILCLEFLFSLDVWLWNVLGSRFSLYELLMWCDDLASTICPYHQTV